MSDLVLDYPILETIQGIKSSTRFVLRFLGQPLT